MKKANYFFFTISLFLMASLPANAQQSCSFVIHVDGGMGYDTVVCGAENAPCATIQYGISRALTEGDTLLRIRKGNYTEVITLKSGISLWGGFDSAWSVTGVSTVIGGLAANGEFYTIKADSIHKTTVLSDLNIMAPNVSVAGKSSYGIHISNSTGLRFQRVAIYGGTGANGTNGSDGTDATQASAKGANGGDAVELGGCNSTSSGSGGSGAVTPGYANTAGGPGGRGGYMDANCPFDLNATAGVNGTPASMYAINGYGSPGLGGVACLSGACMDGGSGKNGLTTHGKGGNGASVSAMLVGQFWTPTTGTAGSLGANGTGGGGGGGSGGCDNGTDAYGAGGGGGGSGGIASAVAGTGGMSGGNSAAVFMIASTCTFVQCQVVLGKGGSGGSGGKSGLGTAGGSGGSGGKGIGPFDGAPGGKGGDGGDGGNSGGGGGGAGGSVYGIFGINAVIYRSETTFIGGTAGTFGIGGTGTLDTVAGDSGMAGVLEPIGGATTDNVTSLSVVQDPCSAYLNIATRVTGPQVVIYPNPSLDGTINITNRFPENAIMDIFDMTGKLDAHYYLPAQTTTAIQIPGKGMFLLRSRFANGNAQAQKIWVE